MSDCECENNGGCTRFFIICFLIWFIFWFVGEIRYYERIIKENNSLLREIEDRLDNVKR